jgi:hypothetical protein
MPILKYYPGICRKGKGNSQQNLAVSAPSNSDSGLNSSGELMNMVVMIHDMHGK